jgi:hypothetical protein
VTGDHAIPSLGSMPTEAAERLKQYADTGRLEHQVVAAPGDTGTAADGRALAGIRLAAHR